ncbi:hypothetical protein R6Q57_001397, partial [Mikania cordata]
MDNNNNDVWKNPGKRPAVGDWIEEERLTLPRLLGDAPSAHRLPALGVPLERAYSSHVARSASEAQRMHELVEEVRVLREENQHLRGQVNYLQEQVVNKIAGIQTRTK